MKRKHVLLLVAAAVLLGAAAITLVSWRAARQSPTRRLARMNLERPFAPRLSIPTRYHDCRPAPPDQADSDGTVPRDTCGISDPGSLKRRDYTRAGASIHPDSLQASALADLIWWGDEEVLLDDAVTHLETAAGVSGNSAAVLVDLSAAYLVRAERTDNPLDLVRGLNTAYEALAREPGNTSARFNAALALQRMGFAEQAAREWQEFLAVDSTSPWATEARRRMQELLARVAMDRTSIPGVSAAQISAVAGLYSQDAEAPNLVLRSLLRISAAKVDSFARHDPHTARELGMNVILSGWGAAVERRENARADSLLNLAGALGRGLAEREKSDSSLVYAVDAIRAVRSKPGPKAVLARVHQAYAAGVRFLNEAHGHKAMNAFAQVINTRPDSEALLQWAFIYQAATAYYGDEDELKRGESELTARLLDVNGSRYPALEGRGQQMLGSIVGLQGRLSAQREQLQLAIECFARAGEDASIAEMHARDAEFAYYLGDAEGAYRSQHRFLQAQLRDRKSSDLHKYFIALAGWAERDEMPYAAWAIYNQAADAGYAIAAIDVLELHVARARVRRAVGDSLEAARDLAYASKWLGDLPPGERQQSWAAASLNMARTEGVTLAEMNEAVEAFGQNVVWLAPALARRAERHLAEDSVHRATADLRRLTDIVGQLTEQEESPVFRAAIIERARNVFDRLVRVHLAADRPDAALRELERGRMSFGMRRAGRLPPGEGKLEAPQGQVAVEYALISDTLFTWTVGDSIRVWKQSIDRDAFLLTVRQANAALESVRAPVPKGALRQLYERLIRPIASHLGGPGTPLVILADGEVAGVPFAALMDGDRYLIENHSLRFAPTLEDAGRPPPRGSGPVLLVADPDFDEILAAPLRRLPGAREEVDSVARSYQRNVVLQDADATREAFIREAQGASVIHYAGHAVFNDVRPERSYLLLAGSGSAGRLTADFARTLQLDSTRLVVLSACRTVRSRTGRSGGFAGFSGALLAAGAGGVVGSMWEVDDQLAQPLMRAFHEQYGKLHNPAEALRQAQLHMLRNGDADESSPAAWAGFRYMGS